ncbi:nucleotidyltransferase domain-containing protein [Occultella glacieicola]|uniref:Nucleotidyltransferase domain-containing protein n=1 Tax=Occultella glacieicola TaxID=2518684 RepID=A0ABY2E3U8_9MICO|nr:nucleotidyltransferase domain-containing protein [Occultella glacieicola]TDE92543.1 nucleotidyltransferase domain-containing protein [Occultella glacieicola]
MIDLRRRAQAFVREEYPVARVAFLGGSSATGQATNSSDLDVLVILPADWDEVSFVETTTFDGQHVEAFVYGVPALERWLAKGRAERRPVLDRLIGHGIPLVGEPLARDLQARSQAVLAAGPEPLAESELALRRYALSATLDDLADAAGTAEEFVLASTAWREASELSLVTDRGWLGTGKWLMRELLSNDDPYGLAAWASTAARHPAAFAELNKLCSEVLLAAGGYLQSGFRRGSRPHGL